MGRDLPTDWASRRRKALKRDNYRCGNCGRKGGTNNDLQLEVHHIVKREYGGTHKLDNLRTLCEECHASVTYDRPAPTYHRKFGGVSSSKFGSRKGHKIVFLLIGWWTIGLGNLCYAIYHYYHHKHSRINKSDNHGQDLEERIDYLNKSIDEKGTEILFNGCPICGKKEMEKERNIPPVVISCKYCNAKFKQKLWALSIGAQYKLVEGDSERLGETHKFTKWRKIGPEQSKKR